MRPNRKNSEFVKSKNKNFVKGTGSQKPDLSRAIVIIKKDERKYVLMVSERMIHSPIPEHSYLGFPGGRQRPEHLDTIDTALQRMKAETNFVVDRENTKIEFIDRHEYKGNPTQYFLIRLTVEGELPKLEVSEEEKADGTIEALWVEPHTFNKVKIKKAHREFWESIQNKI